MTKIWVGRVDGPVGDFVQRGVARLRQVSGYEGEVLYSGTNLRLSRGFWNDYGPGFRVNLPVDWLANALGSGRETLVVERDAGEVWMTSSGLSRRDGACDFAIEKFELYYEESLFNQPDGAEKVLNFVLRIDMHIGDPILWGRGGIVEEKPATRYWAESVVILDKIYEFIPTIPNDLDLDLLKSRFKKRLDFDLNLGMFDPHKRRYPPFPS